VKPIQKERCEKGYGDKSKSERTNTAGVSGEGADLFALLRVPDLHLALVGAHGEMASLCACVCVCVCVFACVVSFRTAQDGVQASRQHVPSYPLHPLYGCHDVVVASQVTQLRHLAGAGAPQVDTALQADAQHVLRRPVDEIQVEVVLWGTKGRKGK
jgi:hypothetical protein